MAAPAGTIGKGVAAVGDAASGLPIVGRILASPTVQAAATGAGTGALDVRPAMTKARPLARSWAPALALGARLRRRPPRASTARPRGCSIPPS